MNGFRTPQLAQLCHEASYAPARQKRIQLDACQALARLVLPDKKYPWEFVCFHITGFRPRPLPVASTGSSTGQNAQHVTSTGLTYATAAPDTTAGLDQAVPIAPELIAAEDLLADLSAYSERISRSLDLHFQAQTGAFYTVEQVAGRFGISEKTVQRWREQGLIGWLLRYPDGRTRIAFPAAAVRFFARRHHQRVRRSRRFSRTSQTERQRMALCLERMAKWCPGRRHEAILRSARRFGRSRETLRNLLAEIEKNRGTLLFEKRSYSISENLCRRIADEYEAGTPVAQLVKRYQRSRSNIYRAMRLHWTRELLARPIEFVDSPEFSDPEDEDEFVMPPPGLFPELRPAEPEDLQADETIETDEQVRWEHEDQDEKEERDRPDFDPDGEFAMSSGDPGEGPGAVKQPKTCLSRHSARAGGAGARAEVKPDTFATYWLDVRHGEILNRRQEAWLFRKYNFLKRRFVQLGETLNRRNPQATVLEAMRQSLTEADAIRDRLTRANLRLVVSIARKHTRGEAEMFELVSEGNMVLLNAVEKFDYRRGFKFSTYATWAVLKRFASYRRLQARPGADPMPDELLEVAADLRIAQSQIAAIEAARHDLDGVMADTLDERERQVVREHYGLTGRKAPGQRKALSFAEIAARVGLSKERVRQIELSALAKLRRVLTPEQFEVLIK